MTRSKRDKTSWARARQCCVWQEAVAGRGALARRSVWRFLRQVCRKCSRESGARVGSGSECGKRVRDRDKEAVDDDECFDSDGDGDAVIGLLVQTGSSKTHDLMTVKKWYLSVSKVGLVHSYAVSPRWARALTRHFCDSGRELKSCSSRVRCAKLWRKLNRL